MKKWILLIVLALGACSWPIKIGKLSMPSKLIVPVVYLAELECLPDEVYIRVIKRNRRQKMRILTLEGIIRTTH